jgi:hypothetical protein
MTANHGTCWLRNTSPGLSRSPRRVFSHQEINVRSAVAASQRHRDERQGPYEIDVERQAPHGFGAEHEHERQADDADDPEPV